MLTRPQACEFYFWQLTSIFDKWLYSIQCIQCEHCSTMIWFKVCHLLIWPINPFEWVKRDEKQTSQKSIDLGLSKANIIIVLNRVLSQYYWQCYRYNSNGINSVRIFCWNKIYLLWQILNGVMHRVPWLKVHIAILFAHRK